jgi:homoserine dehydrogenase
MIKEGLSFETALKQAQEKGYAEADPTADVEGHDACRKICILAALAFGRHVYPRQVPTEGITKIDAADIQFAEASNRRIKLLGRAVRTDDGKVVAYVAPHLLDEEHQLAGVDDVFNGIVVKGDAIGDVMFYGRGAGKLPTASAVVADVIDAARHFDAKKFVAWADGGDEVVGDYKALPMRWYIRTEASPLQIGAAFGEVEMLPGGPTGQAAFLTAPMGRRQVEEKAFPILSLLPVLE